MKLGQIRIKALHIVLVAGFISSGCGMLGGLMSLSDQEGLGLAAVPTVSTLGYEITTSAPNDLRADAGYLYGIYKAQ